jgi:hypothetical protein
MGSFRGGVAFPLVLLAVAAVGTLSQIYHWPQIADDAFVFFRYAEHLASGAGLSWNVGGEPVEGFSSPLWVSMLAVASWLGASPVSAAKALGVIGLAVTASSCGLLTFDLARSRWAAMVAVGAIAVSKPLHYWAPSGMETSLHTALVVVSLVLLTRERALAGAVVLGLAGVARPEGPLLVALVAGAYAFTSSGRRKLVVPLVAAAPALLYEILRLVYFGELLPNTYFAKVGGSLSTRLIVWSIYGAMGIVLWLAVTLAWSYSFARRKMEPGPLRSLLLVLAAATVILISIVWSGGDWMWHFRFLCPALPILVAAVTGSAWALISGSAADRSDRASVIVGGVVAVVAILGIGSVGLVSPREFLSALRGSRLPPAQIQEGTMTDVSREVARYLEERSTPQTLIAVNHSGAVPYYSDLPTIDMTGLNDRHIARRTEGGLHGKFDPDYVLGRRPKFIVMNSRVEPNTGTLRGPDGAEVPVWYFPGYWEGETALIRREEFQRNYRFVARYWVWNWSVPRNFILVAERVGD